MTSLYAHNFALLVRPDRAVFSLGSEATRATLPDFADVEQLQTFVRRLHVWRFQVPGMLVQFKFAAVCIAFHLVLAGLTIVRRMYDKSFWLVRILKKPSGRVVVPNALLVFTVVEGTFAIFAIAFLWLFSRWFDGVDMLEAPTNPMLWLAMLWTPLYSGAAWAAWGTYFATPSSEQLYFGMRERPMQSFFGHALTINTLGLLWPVTVTLTIAWPAIISNRDYMRGLRMGQDWSATYGGQATFTQDMVQDAQLVWFQAIASMYTGNIVFICWSFHAFALAAGYATISLRLLSFIRRELENHIGGRTPGGVVGIITTHVFTKEQRDEERGGVRVTQVCNVSRHDDTVLLASSPGDDSDDTAINSVVPTDTDGHKPCLSAPSKGSNHGGDARGWRRYVPNILMRNDGDIDDGDDSRTAQTRKLRRAFIHIIIQFAAIFPATTAFGLIACAMAVSMYGATEQASATGGTEFELVISVVGLVCFYTVVVAGFVTLLAIACRTYESVQFGTRAVVTGGAVAGQGGGGDRGDGGEGSAIRLPEQSKGRLTSGLMRIFRLRRQPYEPRRPTHHIMSTFFETHTTVHCSTAERLDSVSDHSSQYVLGSKTETESVDQKPAGVHYADQPATPSSFGDASAFSHMAPPSKSMFGGVLRQPAILSSRRGGHS